MLAPISLVSIMAALVFAFQFHSVAGTIAGFAVACLNEVGVTAATSSPTSASIQTDTGMPTLHAPQPRPVIQEDDE